VLVTPSLFSGRRRAAATLRSNFHGAALLLLKSILLASALHPAQARADVTKATCIEANTLGQDLRRDGKLSAAREQLRRCADPACPGLVRDDCAKRLDEVERMQPTLVLVAKDAAGNDLTAVKVTIDGKPLAERFEGAEIAVDPGEHVFTFVGPDRTVVTKKLVLAEGEKARREQIVFDGGASAAARVARPHTPPIPPAAGGAELSSGGHPAQRILGLVSVVLGAAGIAVGAVYGLRAMSELDAQKSDCSSPTNCPRHTQAVSDHTTLSTDATVSTVAFAAGGVFLVAGSLLFFTAHETTESTGTRLAVSPMLTNHLGPAVVVSGRF
jgi:hypothetical protein